MKKPSSPSFVLTLEMKNQPLLFSIAEKEFEICRNIQNTILGKYLKQEKQMKREKAYNRLIRQYKAVSAKLKKDEKNKFFLKEKQRIQMELKKLRVKYQLTEYASHDWMKPVREHFGNQVNAAIAQKAASRAWLAFEKKLFGKAKKVHFLRKGEMESFEGKSNKTGWRYVDRHIVYREWSTPLIMKKKDEYVSEIIQRLEKNSSFSYTVRKAGKTIVIKDFYHIKYVRIVKKEIRGSIRYFADLVIAGYAPTKQRTIGKGRVGLDVGTSTIGVSSLTQVSLINLAEQVKVLSHEIKLIQRKMDRSKRTINPNNFNLDGTIKKGKKTWEFSNCYRKDRSRLKELHRKQASIRKCSHQTLANHLITLGDTFYTETMNFKALQKRKKETEVSEKTGKYKRKKRFGKSIGHRAPAMFVSILKEKVSRYGGKFVEVNTSTFKASQYCHIRKDYIKKPLSQRWHVIDEHTRIQRDLYSAFLLMNSNTEGTKVNQILCKLTFPIFKELHDLEITNILKQKKMILNSGIIVKNE